ncbi:MAG TPA: hypothetical protein VH854_13515 [Thermoanaerobaculia bacterium]|nr:hypothetical protein [Thermoanaerobaculia bacterium]
MSGIECRTPVISVFAPKTTVLMSGKFWTLFPPASPSPGSFGVGPSIVPS